MSSLCWLCFVALSPGVWMEPPIDLGSPPPRSRPDEPRKKIRRLPTTKVRSGKGSAASDRKDPSGFVTVIDARKAHRRVRDLSEIIREHSGVSVRSLGGLGSYSALSIRGSSPSQVAILLDGVPLNAGGSPVINLADIPVGALGQVALYRGFVPAHLGGAMGGALSLTTRYPPGFRTSTLAISAGSFRTLKLHGHHAGRSGSLQWSLAAQYLSSSGDFRYYDDRGTPLNTADDLPNAWRQNNAMDSGFALGRITWKLHPRWTLSATDLLSLRAQGVPGIGNFRSADATLEQWRNLLQVSLDGLQFPTSRSRFQTQAYWIQQSDLFTDLKGEIGLSRQKTDNGQLLLGWKLLLTFLLWPFLSLSGSSHLRYERAQTRDLLEQKSPESPSRLSWTPALQSTLSLWRGALVALVAGRLEVLHSAFQGPNPQDLTRAWPTGRVGLKVRPWSWLWFKANAGRYVRQPTFAELFGNRGATIGNPQLQPESGWMWDAGAVLSLAKHKALDLLRLEYAFFWTSSSSLIRWIQNSQRTMIAVNIDEAQLLGHEARLKAQLWRLVRIHSALTWMDAKNLSRASFERGNQLPGRPQLEFFLQASLFQSWGRVFYRYRFSDGNFLDRANLRPLAARHLHGLGLQLHPARLARALGAQPAWEGLSITFEIKNLGDARVEQVPLRPPLPQLRQIPQAISDYSGYPLPGRSVYLTVDWKI